MKRNKSFNNETPLLYLLATPIGNLKEITTRALEVLNEADLIAAEDTRNTKSLLAKYDINKPLFSLREHNESEGSEHIINLILNEGKKVVYVSDAGYPGISDPGAILVKKCIQNNISVSTVSGACAFINALVASGLPTDHFYFHGFLNPKESQAANELKLLAKKTETLIFYESPHRIIETIRVLRRILGNREAVIARELTKLNEEYIRGSLEELVYLDATTLKGEMVVMVEGLKESNQVDEKEIKDRVNYFIKKGLSKKDAVQLTAEILDINKNLVYKIAIEE